MPLVIHGLAFSLTLISLILTCLLTTVINKFDQSLQASDVVLASITALYSPISNKSLMLTIDLVFSFGGVPPPRSVDKDNITYHMISLSRDNQMYKNLAMLYNFLKIENKIYSKRKLYVKTEQNKTDKKV